MTPPARPAPEAFRRGLSAVVANPGLILAPLAFAAAAIAAIGGPIFLLLARAGAFRLWSGTTAASWRDPAQLVNRLRDSFENLLAAPAVLLGGLLGLLAVLLLLTGLAAWIRAGVTGSLAAIDAHVPENAPLSAFRLAGLGGVFRKSARRHFGRFFALVNLYGLALSFLVLLLFVPAGLGLIAATSERGSLLALACVLFVLFLPLVIAGSVALRVLYLVAGRLAATEAVDALEAVARAASWTRGSLSRVVPLYLLSLAASFVSGFALFVPRFALSLLGPFLVPYLAGTALLVLAQTLVSVACELAVTGAFVSLWPAASGGSAPPEADARADGVPPLLV